MLFGITKFIKSFVKDTFLKAELPIISTELGIVELPKPKINLFVELSIKALQFSLLSLINYSLTNIMPNLVEL